MNTDEPLLHHVPGLTIERQAGDLHISRSWRNVGAFALLVFCLLWDGFLVFWYSHAIGGTGAMNMIMVFFPIVHVAVGLGLSYFTICLFVNTTHIWVRRTGFEIKHSPLPWPGSALIARATISQLFVQERIHRGKHSTTATYQVLAKIIGSKDKILIKGLPNYEQALKIEQEVEAALGLIDHKVEGEFQQRA